MIGGDWYHWMDICESMPKYHNSYLIDCVGGRIRVYRARDSSIVGSFTAEQAKRFFYGVAHMSDVTVELMNKTIESTKAYLESLGIDYLVKDNNMTLREEFAYLVGTDFDVYDFDERF